MQASAFQRRHLVWTIFPLTLYTKQLAGCGRWPGGFWMRGTGLSPIRDEAWLSSTFQDIGSGWNAPLPSPGLLPSMLPTLSPSSSSFSAVICFNGVVTAVFPSRHCRLFRPFHLFSFLYTCLMVVVKHVFIVVVFNPADYIISLRVLFFYLVYRLRDRESETNKRYSSSTLSTVHSSGRMPT